MVWDSWLRACSYYWNLRDLAPLLRRLQVRSPRILSGHLRRAWAPDRSKKPGWARELFQRWEYPSSLSSTILANEYQLIRPYRNSRPPSPAAPSAHFLPRKLCGEPANKDPYQVSGMKLWLPELQVEEQEARKVRAGSRSPYQVSGMRLRLQGAASGRPVG